MSAQVPSLEFLSELARAAGAELLDRFRGPLEVSRDAAGGLVSEADLAAEALICARLRARFPTHGILAEEAAKLSGAQALPEGPAWLVDPLDGTSNYAQGHPHFAVSLCFGEVAKGRFEPALGVVYQPVGELLFSAERGRGASLNEGRLALAAAPPRDRGSFALSPQVANASEGLALWSRVAAVLERTGPLRVSGSAALDLAYVAAGWVGAFYGPRPAPWDVAAGCLLVEEAGGVATDLAGRGGLSLKGEALLAAASETQAWLRDALGRS